MENYEKKVRKIELVFKNRIIIGSLHLISSNRVCLPDIKEDFNYFYIQACNY